MATISNNDIAHAIYATSRGKSGLELANIMKNTVKFLSRRRLLSKSKDILSNLNKIINQNNGILEVKVWSKDKLASGIKEDLTQFLKKRYKEKDFIFVESLDEKLLGGVKIEAKNELIDLTLKNKIYKLQKHLTENYE